MKRFAGRFSAWRNWPKLKSAWPVAEFWDPHAKAQAANILEPFLGSPSYEGTIGSHDQPCVRGTCPRFPSLPPYLRIPSQKLSQRKTMRTRSSPLKDVGSQKGLCRAPQILGATARARRKASQPASNQTKPNQTKPNQPASQPNEPTSKPTDQNVPIPSRFSAVGHHLQQGKPPPSGIRT